MRVLILFSCMTMGNQLTSFVLVFSSTKWRNRLEDFYYPTWLQNSTIPIQIYIRKFNSNIKSILPSLSFPLKYHEIKVWEAISPCPWKEIPIIIGRIQSWLIIYMDNISYIVWTNYKLVLMSWKLTTWIFIIKS